MFVRVQFKSLIAAALLAMVAIGCSDDQTTPPPPVPLNLAGTLGPAGGTLTSTDGRLSLTVPAGVLTDATDITVSEVEAPTAQDAFTGFSVYKAFQVTPDGIDLGADSELSVTVSWPGSFAKLGDRTRRAIPVAVTALGNDQIERRIPDQIAQLPMAPNVAQVDARVTVRGFPASFLALCIMPEGGPGSIPVWAGGDQRGPDVSEVGNDFDVAIRSACSAIVVDRSAYAVGYGQFQSGVIPILTEGETVVPQQSGTYADNARWDDISVLYHADQVGAAIVSQRLSYGYSFEAGYWDSYDVAQPIGSLALVLQYEDFPLTITPHSNPGGAVMTGIWPVNMAGLEGVGRPLQVQWALSDAVTIAGNNGIGFYSLHSDPPLSDANLALSLTGFHRYGSLTLALGYGNRKVPGDDRVAVIAYGSDGGSLNQWLPDEDAFGFTQLFGQGNNLTDAWPVDGNPLLGAFDYVDNTAGRIFVSAWNDGSGSFDFEGPYTVFTGATGNPVSAFVRQGGSLVVVTDGTPGHLHVHDRANPGQGAALVAEVGDSPRRVRVLGDVGVVSNYGSGSLTIFTWDAADNIAVTATVDVGAGPIGIDLVALTGGQVGIVSTGYNDDSWSVTVVDAAGILVSNTKHDLPAGASAPGHAIWLDDAGAQVLVSCHGSGKAVVADSGL